MALAAGAPDEITLRNPDAIVRQRQRDAAAGGALAGGAELRREVGRR